MLRKCVLNAFGLVPRVTTWATTVPRAPVDRRQLLCRLSEIALAHDGVAAVDALGPVTNHLHGDGPGDPGTLEIPHCGATEVVGDSCRESRPPARRQPCPPEGLDRLPKGLQQTMPSMKAGDKCALALRPIGSACGLSGHSSRTRGGHLLCRDCGLTFATRSGSIGARQFIRPVTM